MLMVNFFGFTTCDKIAYNKGLELWDVPDANFYVGVCPIESIGSLYYMQGTVYTARLYDTALTGEDVQKNREMTLKYRSSF